MKKTKAKKKRKLWQSILIWALRVVGILVGCFLLLLGYLTLTEYRPADQETLEISAGADAGKSLTSGTSVSLLTWNVGYGALGDNSDFFMDGGKSVMTADKARVQSNLQGMIDEVTSIDPDIVFLQEVDRSSLRSHWVDEAETIRAGLADGITDKAFSMTFAYNYRVAFVPYPIPPIGTVNSGIATYSSYLPESSVRYQLPCPFSWPVRLANLKRCVMVDKIPVMNSDGSSSGKYLVLANLHLEAFDSGEGKIAQTQMLKEIIQEEADAGNYVIAGGDFNQTFSNVDISMYPKKEGTWQPGSIDTSDFGSAWQFVMDNTTPSCRSEDKAYAGADQENFQYYMIDGFILSPNIQVDSIKTQSLSFKVSDHNPVVMQFTLK